MNLIEDFKNFLASFSGLTDRLEAALQSQDSLKSENADLKAKLEAAPKVEALKAAEDLAASEKARADKAEADLKAEQEAMPGKINAEVARTIAANGHQAVSTNLKPDQAAQTKPRAEFDAMSHADRNEFIRKGGKVTH